MADAWFAEFRFAGSFFLRERAREEKKLRSQAPALTG